MPLSQVTSLRLNGLSIGVKGTGLEPAITDND